MNLPKEYQEDSHMNRYAQETRHFRTSTEGSFWSCKLVIKPSTLWRDIEKPDGRYTRPKWECDESIRDKSYGNRRSNRILPEISYYLARSSSRKRFRGRKQPCRDERGDRNVTECFKRVSAAGYSAHEARTLQINQGSSGFCCGAESMRAASRCAFLNGQKGQNDALVEKTDGKGGTELISRFID